MPHARRTAGTLPAPGPEIGPLHNRIRHLFEEPFPPRAAAWTPPVDISMTGQELTITVELPGLTPDEVEIELADGLLIIRGEKKEETEKTQDETRIQERSYGAFARSFTLPCPVDEAGATAEFRDGVLRITLPRTEGARGRKIEITPPA